jgi:glycosyltransferase involved in cell wall biosynthesis
MPTRVLIISHEAPGPEMAGPAIRYWHLAEALADEHIVCLAVPDRPLLTGEGFEVVGYQRQGGAPLPALAAEADVLLVMGFLLHRYPFLAETGRPLVVDLYDPFILENLEIHRDRELDDQARIHAFNLAVLNEQLRRGDFFLCAHESQRDFWLGMLAANGRINPYTLADDTTLRGLIDQVPFGLPAEPPQHRRQVLKGVWPGIGRDDQVIYWGGGIWEWFDPLTAIRAVAEVAEVRPNVRLFFSGARHTNPDVPPMRMAAAARALADRMGLTDRLVFFNDWVPYAERENYLLEADVGISLHFEHLETRFSFRTRLLDYIWAGLPMVISSGDALSQLVSEKGLGAVVAPQDVASVRDALLGLLTQPDLRQATAARFAPVRADLTWHRVVEPLRAFCRAPHRAADLAAAGGGEKTVPESRPPLPLRAWRVLRQRGLPGLWNETRAYLRWQRTRARR